MAHRSIAGCGCYGARSNAHIQLTNEAHEAKKLFRVILDRFDGNVRNMASNTGVSYSTLYSIKNSVSGVGRKTLRALTKYQETEDEVKRNSRHRCESK